MTDKSALEEFSRHLNFIANQSIYDAGRSGKFSATQLRSVYHQDKLRAGATALSAKPEVPNDIFDSFLETCGPILGEYISPEADRIGNGIVNLIGGIPQPTIADFARKLILAAAMLGAERTTGLLFSWIDGEPLNYKMKVLLTGVSIDQPLRLLEGIEITELPKSSNELMPLLPPLSMHWHGILELLGQVVLSIDCRAGPALYLPVEGEDPSNAFGHTWANGKIPGLSLDSFCEVLSLACSHCVRWRQHWRDFGDLQVFADAFSGIGFTDVPRWGTAVPLTYEQLEHARNIHLIRHPSNPRRAGLDTAIRRWINSNKSELSVTDRFIELRIALESLYLDDPDGEFGFRLATYAAWHLGEEWEERKKFHDIFRKTYRLASDAVHGRLVEDKDSHKRLLEDAQALCNKGILKRLYEKQAPKWNELILGFEEKKQE